VRTIRELLAQVFDDEAPTAPIEPAEFREESPTIERPRNRRRETADERTLVFRINRR
jgi:hypothetical protein